MMPAERELMRGWGCGGDPGKEKMGLNKPLISLFSVSRNESENRPPTKDPTLSLLISWSGEEHAFQKVLIKKI